MKMLSTPIARTRKGIISKMMSVDSMPMKPSNPIEAPTDRSTSTTPAMPRVTLLSI